MSNSFVPGYVLGGSVIEDHQAYRFRFYMLTIHGVEILDPEADVRRPAFRRVVVRRIHPVVALEDYRNLLDAFQDVVVELAALDGTPAPRILEAYGREGRVHAVVLEPLEGVSLHRIVAGLHEREQPLPVPVALTIARELLPLWRGTARPRLRLRDVVISPAGRVRAWPELASEERMMNATEDPDFTYAPYLPPEEIRGKGQGQRSDTYRLGVLLYELLGGQLPFLAGADTFQEIVRRVIGEPLPPIHSLRPELPERLAALVDRATAHQPAGRFASWDELSTRLAEAQASLEPMDGEALGDWVRSLPAEIHGDTMPSIDAAVLDHWRMLPKHGYGPVSLPRRA